ncbi:MAG: hypothetical protein ISR65_12680 [Bacteriovoracaceae bacterium]|nr:hypothetical protein [Bacteriovoracaceae bacterium]
MKIIKFPKSPKLKYANSLIRSVNEVLSTKDRQVFFDLTATEELDALAISFLCGLINMTLENNPKVSIKYPLNKKIKSVVKLLEKSITSDKLHETKIQSNSFQLRKVTSNNNLYIEQMLTLLQIELKFGESTRGSLRIVLTELLTNSIDHSGEKACYICLGRWPNSPYLHLVCLDFGVGIPAKLRTRFPELDNDVTAFKNQHEQGLTTRRARDGGRGYRLIQDILMANKGRLNIISNSAKVSYKYDKGDYKVIASKEGFTGTCVDIQFNPSRGGFEETLVKQHIEDFF